MGTEREAGGEEIYLGIWWLMFRLIQEGVVDNVKIKSLWWVYGGWLCFFLLVLEFLEFEFKEEGEEKQNEGHKEW